MKSLKSIVLNWIGGGKTPIPVRFLKSIDVPGNGQEQNIVKPIVLTALPTAEMTTQEELDAIGLTLEEIIAAAEGKRNGCILEGTDYKQFFYISRVFFDITNSNYMISFNSTAYDNSGYPDPAEFYTVSKSNNNVTVVEYIV